MNVVYLMTDTINNLKYIGSKVNWKGKGSYFGSPSSLNEDNPKYELQLKYKTTVNNYPDKIEVQILEEVKEKTQLLNREKYWQKKYNAIKSLEFINASYAGYGFGSNHSEVSKIKMSKSHIEFYENNPKRKTDISNQFSKTVNAINLITGKIERVYVNIVDNINYEVYLKGERHPMYGKTHTDEAKEKIREASKNHIWTDERKQNHANSLKGRKFSDEHKNKLRESNLGSNNPNFGNFTWNKNIEINGEIRTAKEWKKYFNLNKLSDLKTYLINNNIQYD